MIVARPDDCSDVTVKAHAAVQDHAKRLDL